MVARLPSTKRARWTHVLPAGKEDSIETEAVREEDSEAHEEATGNLVTKNIPTASGCFICKKLNFSTMNDCTARWRAIGKSHLSKLSLDVNLVYMFGKVWRKGECIRRHSIKRI